MRKLERMNEFDYPNRYLILSPLTPEQPHCASAFLAHKVLLSTFSSSFRDSDAENAHFDIVLLLLLEYELTLQLNLSY